MTSHSLNLARTTRELARRNVHLGRTQPLKGAKKETVTTQELVQRLRKIFTEHETEELTRLIDDERVTRRLGQDRK